MINSVLASATPGRCFRPRYLRSRHGLGFEAAGDPPDKGCLAPVAARKGQWGVTGPHKIVEILRVAAALRKDALAAFYWAGHDLALPPPWRPQA